MPTAYEEAIKACAQIAGKSANIAYQGIKTQDRFGDGLDTGNAPTGYTGNIDLMLKDIGMREYDRCMKKKGYER